MILYLLRHAVAKEKSDWTKADRDRPLTKEGLRKMKKAAGGLKRLDLDVDLILTSPYRRAYDTAWVAAKALHRKKHLETTAFLAPEGHVKELLELVKRHARKHKTILLVGHNPYLSRLLSLLTSGSPDAQIAFDKGGLAKLTCDSLTYGRCATLEWLIPSALLRHLD